MSLFLSKVNSWKKDIGFYCYGIEKDKAANYLKEHAGVLKKAG